MWTYGADVWGLGVVLYALLSNTPLRWEEGALDFSSRVLRRVSAPIKALLLKVVVVDAEHRVRALRASNGRADTPSSYPGARPRHTPGAIRADSLSSWRSAPSHQLSAFTRQATIGFVLESLGAVSSPKPLRRGGQLGHHSFSLLDIASHESNDLTIQRQAAIQPTQTSSADSASSCTDSISDQQTTLRASNAHSNST